MMKPFAMLAVALLVGACDAEPVAPPMRQAVPIPKKDCVDARAGLEALAAKAVLVYQNDGSATIDHESWLQLPQAAREAIAQQLAYHAACVAPTPPLEVEVHIAGDSGATLLRRTIELAVDPAAILADE